MKKEERWLKEAIVSYIQTHAGADSVDVVSHMKLRCDITLIALRELEEEGLLERYWNGRYYEVRLKK